MNKTFEYKLWLIYPESPPDKDGDGLGAFQTRACNLSKAIKNIQKRMSHYLAKSKHNFGHRQGLKKKLSLFFVTNNLNELGNMSICKKTNREWQTPATIWRGGIIADPELVCEIKEINSCLLLKQHLDEAIR